ncbi:hypothetical protein SAMN05216338_102027 [Bradyrhizobium sp. Rc2d]|nr:hypothetical protein SAMN05216338_102027 [Bradyrhizobium sp. Rc2d]
MMAMNYRRSPHTSPRRGEVDLRSKSGEGPQLHRETKTPHPRLRRDLSLRERWTFDAAASQPTSGKF